MSGAERRSSRYLDAAKPPLPGDTLGPTEGLSADSITIETLGYTYLEMADERGNSAARQRMRTEMMHIRAETRNQGYMHHWPKYQTTYQKYAIAIRDSPHDFP